VNFAIAVSRFSGREPDALEVAAQGATFRYKPPPLPRISRVGPAFAKLRASAVPRKALQLQSWPSSRAGTPSRRGSKEHKKACVGKTLQGGRLMRRLSPIGLNDRTIWRSSLTAVEIRRW